MASTTALSSVSVLGKRRARTKTVKDLVLHLSASESGHDPSDEPWLSEVITDEDDEAAPSAEPSSRQAKVTSKSRKPREKRYLCSHEGCDKAYTKPSRLAEHERSHTGERPFVCTTCNKSYLRENHLQAHSRTHLSSSDRPFQCDHSGCDKRFWTSQHLVVHKKVHEGDKPFQCEVDGCSDAFAKHHQLRSHICDKHAPPGTKSYICSHEGCTRSFATNQKLKAHMKTHNENRYTCGHPSCLTGASSTPKYYPTWSALQHHLRTAHPPTCPHASCNGRTFTQRANLRMHLKLHEQYQAEGASLVDEPSDDDTVGGAVDDRQKPKKRRRGGEFDRDWKCTVDGCGKDFKSQLALSTHHKVKHLGRRDFVCPVASCQTTYGYKHLLQRHMSRVHTVPSCDDEESDSDDDKDSSGATDSDSRTDAAGARTMGINDITGVSYTRNAQCRVAESAALQCPYPHIESIGAPTANGAAGACEYVFKRAYDLRRHLRAAHGVERDKDTVDGWVKRMKENNQ